MAPFTFHHAIFVLVTIKLLLIQGPASTGAVTKLINFSYIGGSSDQELLTPNFPVPYKLNSTIYTYYIQHSNKYSGRIQITFEDFDINKRSLIKIFDGNSTKKNLGYTYTFNTSRPIFQSTKSTVLLIFKTGQSSGTRTERGFRAIIRFVSYERTQWVRHNMPSIGSCPSVDFKNGYVQMTGKEMTANFYDCIWLIRIAKRTLTLKLHTVQLHSGAGTLEVRSKESRGTPLVSHTAGTFARQPVESNMYSSNQGFYVRLKANLTRDDSIEFLFGTSSSLVEKSTPPRLRTSNECLYKTGQRGICINYWDSISRTKDGTCDPYINLSTGRVKGVSQCPKNDRCYAGLDTCDGFNDCGSFEDEKSSICDKGSESEASAAAVAAVAAASPVPSAPIAQSEPSVIISQPSHLDNPGTNESRFTTSWSPPPAYTDLEQRPGLTEVSDASRPAISPPPSYEEAIRISVVTPVAPADLPSYNDLYQSSV